MILVRAYKAAHRPMRITLEQEAGRVGGRSGESAEEAVPWRVLVWSFSSLRFVFGKMF